MEIKENSAFVVIERYNLELEELYGTPEIKSIVSLLFSERLGWNRADLQQNLGMELEKADLDYFLSALSDLLRHVPVQYIIGKAPFLDMEMNVTPAVLIPRPETEELVETILSSAARQGFHPETILEIGTGSGCIGIALGRKLKPDHLVMTDISADALAVAAENARACRCEAELFRSDILDEKQWEPLPASDLIVSNPPYVTFDDRLLMRPNVLDHEPPIALFAPDNDPLAFYRAIGRMAQTKLRPGGWLWFETNEKYGKEVEILLNTLGFRDVAILNDLSGRARFAGSLKAL